jgi:hypothetical protein
MHAMKANTNGNAVKRCKRHSECTQKAPLWKPSRTGSPNTPVCFLHSLCVRVRVLVLVEW